MCVDIPVAGIHQDPEYFPEPGKFNPDSSYQGTVPTLVVGDADILREILVTKFKSFSDRSLSQTVGSDVWKKSIINLSGDEWKKARAVFTPALTATRLKVEEQDFLQVFMNADYSWKDAAEKKSDSSEIKKMSVDEITAQGIGFFVAGVESVSTALTVTAYYLALNPDCQDRVIAEVDNALEKGELTYDSLQEMQYLDACIKEAMRLCTPDSISLRLCTEETTVAGIHFKPGMCVDIPLVAIHHDPEYFPDPERFNPERWVVIV
ncbi:hypothetical protein MTO96_023484 [Rhipicephalus appendiculatus]